MKRKKEKKQREWARERRQKVEGDKLVKENKINGR